MCFLDGDQPSTLFPWAQVRASKQVLAYTEARGRRKPSHPFDVAHLGYRKPRSAWAHTPANRRTDVAKGKRDAKETDGSPSDADVVPGSGVNLSLTWYMHQLVWVEHLSLSAGTVLIDAFSLTQERGLYILCYVPDQRSNLCSTSPTGNYHFGGVGHTRLSFLHPSKNMNPWAKKQLVYFISYET